MFIINAAEAETLSEKITQLIVVPVFPHLGEEHLAKVKALKVGGVIVMTSDLEATEAFLKELSPMLCFQDAEWGVGMRMRGAPVWPKSLTLGAIQDKALLKAFGRALGRECRTLGLQGNFAPVADVNNNPLNPVIKMRSFGDDPEEVAERALLVMQGMQEMGLLTCAKHFPGHGNTSVDSHLDLPVISGDLKIELIPFRRLIEGGVDLIMMGHLEVKGKTASLSKEIIEGLLRQELGFKGVVITDSLVMKALKGSQEEIALQALEAGNDMLLWATASLEGNEGAEGIFDRIPSIIAYIEQACLEGRISPALIEAKWARVQALRNRSFPPVESMDEEALRRELWRSALTGSCPVLVRGEPLALITKEADPLLFKTLSRYTEVKTYTFDEFESVQEKVALIRYTDKITPEMGGIPEKLAIRGVTPLITLLGSPYALLELPSAFPVLVGYEENPQMKEAVADALFGVLLPSGKLPIRLWDKEKGEADGSAGGH